MSDTTLSVEGTLFTFSFYYVCPDGHIHVAEVKTRGLIVEKLTAEEVTRLRDNIMETMGKGFRPATEAEIDRYVMAEQYAEEVEKQQGPRSDYFMMPGVKEAQ